MIAKLIPLLVLLVACQGPVLEGKLFISEEFSEEDAAIIVESVDAWNIAMDKNKVEPVIGDGDGWKIVDGDLSPSYVLGKTSPGSKEIVIDVDDITSFTDEENLRREYYMKTAVLHELGHALGIHEHLKKGLMTPRRSAFMCIDTYSIKTLCDEIDCGPKPTNVDVSNRTNYQCD